MSGAKTGAAASREDWLYVWSDGASRGNPGPAGAGGRVIDPGGKLLAEISDYLGETTSNVAEYHALAGTLEAAVPFGFRRVRVRTDSELLARQLTGTYKVRSKALQPLALKVRRLLAEYEEVEVEHVPRERNVECDLLANRAIDEGLAGIREAVPTSGLASLF